MVTCKCTRPLNPGGKSILICQVPPVPPNLLPGTYIFNCKKQDGPESDEQLEFNWTGSDWRLKNWTSHNQSQSWLDQPVIVTRDGKRSFFNKKPQLRSTLIVSKSRFVPLENLNFELSLRNCTNDNIGNVVIEFVQNSNFGLGGKEIILLRKRLSDCLVESVVDGEIFWAGKFLIPHSLMPSLTKGLGDPLEVSYYLQFAVETPSGKLGLCGRAPVIIGRAGEFRREVDGDEEFLNFMKRRQSQDSDASSRRSSVESASSQKMAGIRKFPKSLICAFQPED